MNLHENLKHTLATLLKTLQHGYILESQICLCFYHDMGISPRCSPHSYVIISSMTSLPFHAHSLTPQGVVHHKMRTSNKPQCEPI